MRILIENGDTHEVRFIAENDDESRRLAGLYMCGVKGISLKLFDAEGNEGEAQWIFTLRRTPREAQKLMDVVEGKRDIVYYDYRV